jgi:hypothetical protein
MEYIHVPIDGTLKKLLKVKLASEKKTQVEVINDLIKKYVDGNINVRQ